MSKKYIIGIDGGLLDDGLSNIIADGCDVGIRLEQGLDEHMTAVPVSPPSFYRNGTGSRQFHHSVTDFRFSLREGVTYQIQPL